MASGKKVRVVAELIVNESGEVQDVRVVKSDDRAFDDAALAALRKYRYSPPLTSQGEVVKVFWMETVWFNP